MSAHFRTAILFAFPAFFAAAELSRANAATYDFDSKHAGVDFTYHVGFVAQSGRFTAIDGLFQFDPLSPGLGSIDAVIKTSSLSASAWEAELKGSDFFNVSVFPEIRFKSRSVRPAGENSAVFLGDLTMKGVTRPISLRAQFLNGHHVSAKARIKRSDFNMTALSFLIGDEIEIEIEAELIEK